MHVLYSRIIKQVKDCKYKKVYFATAYMYIQKLEREKRGAYNLKYKR